MKSVTVRLTDEQLDTLDDAVDRDIYPNRSEAIRDALRGLLDGREHREVLADGGSGQDPYEFIE